jgi:NADH-quinone oxidoreductase subunit J
VLNRLPFLLRWAAILLIAAAELCIFAVAAHLVAFNLFKIIHYFLFLTPTLWGVFFTVVLPAIALVMAAYLSFSTHPLHSLFCLVGAFLILSIIFIAHEAEFLGYLLQIVYIGAIAILFLFVIMLLNVRDLSEPANTRGMSAYTALLKFVLVVSVLKSMQALRSFFFSFFASTAPGDATLAGVAHTTEVVVLNVLGSCDLLLFSQYLFGDHAFLFIMTTFLLLTAMLGAIILATNTTDQSAA